MCYRVANIGTRVFAVFTEEQSWSNVLVNSHFNRYYSYSRFRLVTDV